MERSIFDEWFNENIKSWLDATVAAPGEPVDFDGIGIIGIAAFFDSVADYLIHASESIALYDNKMNLSNAYDFLSSSISWFIDNGILDGDWEEIADLFNQRAGEFVGGPDYSIDLLPDDPNTWTDVLDQVMWSYKNGKAAYTSDGEFGAAEKVQLVRALLLTMRNKGYLDYSWPWFKQLISSLGVDWRVMGGGFPSTIDPTYDPPWSHA